MVTYSVTGDPVTTFDKIKTLAASDGWVLLEPTETISGTTLRGHKPVGWAVPDRR